jgi:hypothetical protein
MTGVTVGAVGGGRPTATALAYSLCGACTAWTVRLRSASTT